MLLQRLKEYADERMTLPPALYSEAPVRYIVELDGNGRLLSTEPVDTADPSSPATRKGRRFLVPQVQRSSAVKPLLLADNAEYVLGLGPEAAKPERVRARHAAFMEVLHRCAVATCEPVVETIERFLADEPLAQLRLPDDYDRGATMTLRVDGRFAFDLPAVQAFWAQEHDPGARDGAARVMQCLVCGRERPALERLTGKLKGVPGGHTTGTALISANEEAFTSYGLAASYVAPTCAECGDQFTKAANELLAKRESHIRIGDAAALVFWTRREMRDFDLFTALTEPDPEQIRALVDALRRGTRVPEVDDTAFYATVLSGSGGRAVVRDWIDTTVGAVKRSLGQWFAWQAICGGYGEAPRALRLYALAAATVRDANRDLAPPTPRALLHAALTGTPVPVGLLYQAVRRNRAEQAVTRPRAALIKLVLRSHAPDEEDTMVQLNADHPSPAYQCGRLLAVLEEAQRRAIGPGLSATIVDRFYGTASTAPLSVFSRLLRGARPHLAKLNRDTRPVGQALERRMEDITGRIAQFPSTLTLNEQGLFALGYYHQRAHDRAQAREAAERRRAGNGGSAGGGDDTVGAAQPAVEEAQLA